MWEQGGYDNAGGFYEQGASQAGDTGTPGGGQKRRQRAQNLVPVSANDILGAGEEGLKIESLEVGMITVVGKVESVEHADTKSTYRIKDDTGAFEAVHWIDESSGNRVEEGIHEGSFARVVGSIRSQQDKKYVMVFRIAAVECEEEVDAHALEILHAKLKIKEMLEKENAAIGANAGGGLANSMVGVGAGGNSGNSSSFGNAKHDSVYKMVAGCNREEGMSREELAQALSSRMSKADVDQALEFLSDEGHIYSTTDEDHFKTTDS